MIDGLEWAIQNRSTYNIRVVNLSLVSSMPESYLSSPLDAAVEAAWLSGIVVVVSAGNSGADSMLYPPANDPLAITVGAVDNNDTAAVADDVIPSWSSYGQTQDGISKPEVSAPGRKIVSNLASMSEVLAKELPDRIVDGRFFRLSGTSMAAPVVSGIAALVLQAHPDWTPDQVKSALMSTARPLASPGAGKGEVDALAAVSMTSPGYANQGIPLNVAISALVGSSNFNSASWNSASWNSASWNSASWNSASWNCGESGTVPRGTARAGTVPRGTARAGTRARTSPAHFQIDLDSDPWDRPREDAADPIESCQAHSEIGEDADN